MKSVFRRLGNQSGQGVLEYILVLTVVVAIVVGLLWRFSDSFRAWGNNYFGEYLACLLETGELPTVGGTGGGVGICNQYFEPFSPTAGRPPKPGGGETGGGGNSANNSSNKVGQTSGGRGGRSGGSRIGGASSSSNSFRAGSSGGASGSSEAARNKKSVYTGSTESSMPSGIYNNRTQEQRVRFRTYNGISGFAADKPEEAKVREGKIGVKNSAGGRAENQKMLVKRKLAASEEFETNDEMGFGDYLRFLIIAAIILALVIFIGGQALQVGKSMD